MKIILAEDYRGYISEFILFTRSLTDEERQDIEAYLSKKYGLFFKMSG